MGALAGAFCRRAGPFWEESQMTIRNLEIFVAVCENMNMSAAAAKLFVSQSAVSQSIRDLETHFNLRLFERNLYDG